jgi:dextranase
VTLEIRDIWPDRATYHPGDSCRIMATVYQMGAKHPRVTVQARLTWLNRLVTESLHTVALATDTETILEFPLALPRIPFRGYGVTVTFHDDAGEMLAQSSTALDVLENWAQAPRYGFLSDFAPDDPSAEAHVAALSRYHINVAQFYDWMWRHYALMPPADEFTDALGRNLSLRTVRAKVAACRSFGMAALGYAAVYGAEQEYALAHPDEMLYDAHGKPYSLGELFYIMNLAPNNPWRDRIFATMRDAVRDVPFDGLHLDQYGPPREPIFDVERRPYDFAPDFATFIDDARNTIQQPDREVGVIFNAVENWPIEQVAPTSQDAVYIEVWPPDERYDHLQSLITNAQRLAPAKQVILAAYMKPLGEATEATLKEAEAATRLTSATIWANGGFHLLMGEQDAALHDPYYVNHTMLRQSFARVMRAYYDFVVRYLNVLSDRRLALVSSASSLSGSLEIEGQRVSTDAQAGTVWAIMRAMPGYLTISLINLADAATTDWNAPTSPPTPRTTLRARARLTGAPPVRGIFAATPDDGDGAMTELRYSVAQTDHDSVTISFEAPSLHYWTLLVIELEQGQDHTEEGYSRHD